MAEQIGVADHEARMRGKAESLAEWQLAEDTATGLALVLLRGEPRTFEGTMEEAAPILRAYSQEVIGIRVFRTIRASMAVLACGYAPEARALDRILVELVAHRKVILDDPTGGEARRWLEGKSDRGISAKVNAMQPEDLYRNLSQDSHGDPRSVWRLYDPESESILLGPKWDPVKTRASLLMHAGVAIDQTQVVATLNGLQVNALSEAIDHVKAGWQRLEEDAPTPE